MILTASPLSDWIQSHGVQLSQIQDLDRELISGRILQQVLDLPHSDHLWRRIAFELAPLGIVVTDACIAAIQAGDAGLVCDILAELHNRSTTTDQLIATLQVSLHTSLHIDQAFAFQLLDHRINIQLSEYLRQGRPGVIEWLSSVISSIDTICTAIGSQPLNLIYILRLLSPALHCQTDPEICHLSARTLALIAMRVLPKSISMMECAWQWISGPSAGLSIIVDSWRLHPSLSFILMPMLECLVSNCISDVVRFLLPNIIIDDAERYGFIQELLIASSPNHQSSYLTEAVIGYVFHDVLANISNQASSETTVVSGLNLITEIMASYYQELTHIDPEYCNSVLALLRQGCRSQAHIDVQMASIANLSELLELCLEKDPACDQQESIRVFKSLIFILMDRYDDTFLRHFISYNLCIIVEQHASLPVDILLFPMVKQIPLHSMTNKDVEFLVALSRHEQLSLKSGTLFLHVLAKFCLQNPGHVARMASIPFCILLCRFQDHVEIQQYIQKLSSMAIRTVIESEDININADPGLATLALELIAKIVHLPYASLKAPIHSLIVSAIRKYREIHGYGHIGLETLDDYLSNESEFGLADLVDIPPSENLDSEDVSSKKLLPNIAASTQPQENKLPQTTSNISDNDGHTPEDKIDSAGEAKVNAKKVVDTAEIGKKNIQATVQNERKGHRIDEKSVSDSQGKSFSKGNQLKRKSVSNQRVPAKIEIKLTQQDKYIASSPSQPTGVQTARINSDSEPKKIGLPKHVQQRDNESGFKFKSAQENEKSFAESDQVEGLSPLLKQNDRLLREAFREYKRQRPGVMKFSTFDLQTKAEACMSISDFIKFWEDISICPGYISKTAVSGIFRSCCSGELSAILINNNEFIQAVWKIAKYISQDIDNTGQDSDVISRTVFILERIKEGRETARKTSTSKKQSQPAPAASKQKPGSPSQTSSKIKFKEDQIADEVVTVMMNLLSKASWQKLDRKQLKTMLRPRRKSVPDLTTAIPERKPDKELEEREKRRQQRRKELAIELAAKRHDAAIREAARKAEIEEAKRKEEEMKAARKKASEQEKIIIRKRLELYHKRKQEEEQKRKEIEEAKKQLELAERKKSIALFQKQKKEREELEQQLQAQKLAIEQANKSRIPSRQGKSTAASRKQSKTEDDLKGKLVEDKKDHLDSTVDANISKNTPDMANKSGGK